MKRKQIASETVKILEQGLYQTPQGMTVNITHQLKQCVNNTQCYTPDNLAA